VQTLSVKTRSRNEARDVTAEVERVVRASGVESGVCYLYVPHTTAGITINEHADPDVMADVEDGLGRLFPRDAGYRHLEGNADAHIKSVLVGASQSIPIEDGRLTLGTWQGIFFCEFDGPRDRQLRVKIVAG
jgi:secondary thiamine-phosphate synthase enzyme